LHLIGEEYDDSQIDLSQNKFQISDASFLTIYHIQLDSIGNLEKKEHFQVPITSTSSGAKRTKNSFLLNFQNFENITEDDFTFECDVYKSTNQTYCFSFVNSIPFQLKKKEDKFNLTKTRVSENRLIEDYYYTQDKLDLNGKLCVDSLVDLPNFFYSKPNFPVKIQFKQDSAMNPCWILSKHSLQKNNVNYSVLHPLNNVFKIEAISDITEVKSPGIISLTKELLLIFHQSTEDQFNLNYFSW